MRKSDLREDIRWKLHYRLQGGPLVTSWSCDISQIGLSFVCDRAVATGTPVEVLTHLIVREHFKKMHFHGKVVYANYSGEIQGFRVGIRYTDLSDQQHADLTSFLEHIDSQRGN